MDQRKIYLAGGCFWGIEAYFKQLPGVLNTQVGYANGKTPHANYQEITLTDHTETLELIYDIHILRLQEVLLHFFRIIDPLSINQQGNDIGRQYRSGVYYQNPDDLPVIEQVFKFVSQKLNVTKQLSTNSDLAVEIEPLAHFIPAEEYHQDYLSKNPSGYCHISLQRAKEPLITGNYTRPNEAELRSQLNSLAYAVTQESATERPFSSKFAHAAPGRGIYVNVVTGQPLFLSDDQFDSGCGWPSFTRPAIAPTNTNLDSADYLPSLLTYHEDYACGYLRQEVRTSLDNAHLGHVFSDGPTYIGGQVTAAGQRFCINGAALRFIAWEDMQALGYGDYQVLFAPPPNSHSK